MPDLISPKQHKSDSLMKFLDVPDVVRLKERMSNFDRRHHSIVNNYKPTHSQVDQFKGMKRHEQIKKQLID